MNEPIEDVYFNWLYTKVASVECPTPSLTHWTLLNFLHSTEFVWLVSGDDNRVEDGLDLRREFYKVVQLELDEELSWYNLGCSVLEMLISFARRAEFQTTISTREWFWIFLENLGLSDLNDAADDIVLKANESLDIFIWRAYDSSGHGGLFPIKNTRHDQRKIEIWYQFCEYLVDNNYS